jgi:hypothetical protein
MDEGDVRERAEAVCAALVAGDIERAAADFSPELRRNLGEVVALLPLPSHEGSVETVAHGGTGYVVAIRLVGETEEVMIQTRWKERDGHPTLVEASHLSRQESAARSGEPEVEAGESGDASDGGSAPA